MEGGETYHQTQKPWMPIDGTFVQQLVGHTGAEDSECAGLVHETFLEVVRVYWYQLSFPFRMQHIWICSLCCFPLLPFARTARKVLRLTPATFFLSRNELASDLKK